MPGLQETQLSQLWSELAHTAEWGTARTLIARIREVTCLEGADISVIDMTSIFAPLVLTPEQLRGTQFFNLADFLEGEIMFSPMKIQEMSTVVRRKRGRDARASNLGVVWRIAEVDPAIARSLSGFAKEGFNQLFSVEEE